MGKEIARDFFETEDGWLKYLEMKRRHEEENLPDRPVKWVEPGRPLSPREQRVVKNARDFMIKHKMI